MNAKKSLKSRILMVLVFLFIGAVYLYFASESVCAAGLFFAFCYNAHGFPFAYLVSGNVDAASGHISTLPLGGYFSKYGDVLLNPIALFLNLILIFLLSYFLGSLFGGRNNRIKS